MTPRFRLHGLQNGLTAAAVLLIALWLGNELESSRYQFVASRLFVTSALAAPASSGSPKTAAETRAILGRIEIPRLEISAMIAEGTDVKSLSRAVGHLPSTPRPGNPGNCALAGHRDTFFRGLGDVRVNDVIRIVTPGRTHTYRVEWTKVVEPRRVDVLNATSDPSLTLITCYPFVFVGHAPKRFIVRARQVDDTTNVAASE